MKAIIAGGGTGGHLMPGISVARELLRRDPDTRILFVGAEQGIEATVVPDDGFELITLPVGGFKRTGWIRRIRNLFMLIRSLISAMRVLGRFSPDVVVGLGGYASFPVVAAAFFRGVPRVLMEQNVFPGLANRVLGRTSTAVAVADDRAAVHFPGRAVVTGNPVRPGFKSISPKVHQAPLTVLITGGSQGAESVNQCVIEALEWIAESMEGATEALRFVHQTGKRQVEMIREGYQKAGFTAEVASFFDSFEDRFAEADLIVCRAGATTVAEVRAAGRAAIMIPLAFAADDHQRKNARAMVEEGAGIMIDPDDLTGKRLANEIVGLVRDSKRLQSIEENARRIAVLDAESRIVDLIESAVEGK
jgi:UDP-N-acetylglucosamine--N-acetylmuramyl-(pentapeptide) pyrophosphoryl-undecaprenol N-acetylglucosamine transferase